MKIYDSLILLFFIILFKLRLYFVRGCGSVFLKEIFRLNGILFFVFFGIWKGIIGVKFEIYIYKYICIGIMGNNFFLNLNY